MASARIVGIRDERYVPLPEGMKANAKEVRITSSEDGIAIKPRRRGKRRGTPAQAPRQLAALMKLAP